MFRETFAESFLKKNYNLSLLDEEEMCPMEGFGIVNIWIVLNGKINKVNYDL
jgi:hypothetical protein